MEKFADLHMHTIFSDGMSTPEEVAEESRSKGLSCIAITDHDTVDGVLPTRKACEKYSIEVLEGVEVSSSIGKRDVHMLGYLYDLSNVEFVKQLEEIRVSRVQRMKDMVAKVNAMGFEDITYEEVRVFASDLGGKILGRPHLANVMVQKGYVKDLREAFNSYLADDAPAFIPIRQKSPFEAIEMIRAAGGVAVLAHPMLTKVDELIPQMVEAGLGGIEAIYPNNPKNIVEFYLGIAKKHNLIITGGSDAHGSAKKHTSIGRVKIPYELVEALKERAACA